MLSSISFNMNEMLYGMRESALGEIMLCPLLSLCLKLAVLGKLGHTHTHTHYWIVSKKPTV